MNLKEMLQSFVIRIRKRKQSCRNRLVNSIGLTENGILLNYIYNRTQQLQHIRHFHDENVFRFYLDFQIS